MISVHPEPPPVELELLADAVDALELAAVVDAALELAASELELAASVVLEASLELAASVLEASVELAASVVLAIVVEEAFVVLVALVVLPDDVAPPAPPNASGLVAHDEAAVTPATAIASETMESPAR